MRAEGSGSRAEGLGMVIGCRFIVGIRVIYF